MIHDYPGILASNEQYLALVWIDLQNWFQIACDSKISEQKYSSGWNNVKAWDKTILLPDFVYTYYETYKATDKNKSYRFLFEIEAKMGNTIVDTTSGESVVRVI